MFGQTKAPVLAALCVLVAGCPQKVRRVPDRDRARRLTVEVRSYVDTTAVNAISVAPPFAFVATDRGLDRWHLQSGEHFHFGRDQGLPAAEVVSLAVDRARQRLWIGTEAGIMRLDLGADALTELPSPDAKVGALSPTGTLADVMLAAAGDGGAWVGTSRGLFHAGLDGAWQSAGVSDPVTALAVSDGGAVWVGTAGGVAVRKLDGSIRRFGVDEGCDIGRIFAIAIAPSGAVVAVGDVGGRQRVAILDGKACALYRPSPSARIIGVAGTADNFVIVTERGLFARRARTRGVRRLSRRGFRLLPVAGGAADPLGRLRAVGAEIPDAPTAVALAGSDAFIGTRDLGTARIALGDPEARSWLRRKDIASGARHLSVACGKDGACALASGNGALFSLVDGDLSHVELPGEVLAVARLGGDEVVAIRRREEDPGLELLARAREGWLPIPGIAVDTPGPAEVTFAEAAPDDTLWLGLAYATETGYIRHHGVAVIDADAREVTYHRRASEGETRPPGALDVPLHVVGAAFSGHRVFLATSRGVADIAGETVRVLGEDDGLRSEIVRAICRAPSGDVWIATGAGAGKLDGGGWSFPRALRWPVSDLGVDRTGLLWLGTSRGVAVFDGKRARWLDHRLGLLADDVSELAVDRFGRVWVLAGDGMTIIDP